MRVHVLTLAASAGIALAQPCGQPWTAGPLGPAARSEHAMAYDSLRDVVVLFGGRNGITLLPETWEWDAHGGGGAGAWSMRTSAGPGGRYGVALAFDPSRGRTVLFGGVAGQFTFNDVWEWNGTTWTQVPAAISPPARSSAVMAFDQVRSRLAMHGGLRENTILTDTWEWNGTVWEQRAAAGPFYPAIGMTLDPSSGHAVMLAGTPSFGPTRLWQWDGTTWTILPGAPPQSRDGCLVYDGTLRFLGHTGVPLAGAPMEAWSYDGAVWTARDTTGPQVRRLTAAAYDGHHVLIFGGLPVTFGPNVLPFADTWLYDGADRSGPLITQPPAGAMVNPGEPVQLTIAATGTAPLSYQWRRNGQAVGNGGGVSGATTPQLSISAASGVHEGRYDVAVTDVCGTTTLGAVWVGVYCYPNCDASTTAPVLNVQDFACFLGTFASGHTYANCDRSTSSPVLNVLDFICYLNAFAAGCP